MSKFEERNKAIADWWLDAFDNPKFDNGDTNPMSMMLATLVLPRSGIKQEAKAKFREELMLEFADVESFLLRSDYHPEGKLSKLMLKADIYSGFCPWKTRMLVEEDIVEVRCGYGADYVIVWRMENGGMVHA